MLNVRSAKSINSSMVSFGPCPHCGHGDMIIKAVPGNRYLHVCEQHPNRFHYPTTLETMNIASMLKDAQITIGSFIESVDVPLFTHDDDYRNDLIRSSERLRTNLDNYRSSVLKDCLLCDAPMKLSVRDYRSPFIFGCTNFPNKKCGCVDVCPEILVKLFELSHQILCDFDDAVYDNQLAGEDFIQSWLNESTWKIVEFFEWASITQNDWNLQQD